VVQRGGAPVNLIAAPGDAERAGQGMELAGFVGQQV
jgi:hypothetical protein